MLGQAEMKEILKRIAAARLALRGELRVNDTGARFDGVIRISEVPFESHAEFVRWWLPTLDDKGKIVQAARMSDRDKERYAVLEARNLLTSTGRTYILGYIGSPAYISSQTPFSQYFEVGTYPFAYPSAADNAVAGPLARVVPSTAIITGTQIDISCFFGSSTGNGNWTNAGLWGNNATATLGSGSLMTHSAFAYNKQNGNSVTVDYLVNLT